MFSIFEVLESITNREKRSGERKNTERGSEEEAERQEGKEKACLESIN